MPRFFTHYWSNATCVGGIGGTDLDYTSGNAFEKRGVSPGDIVFAVTVYRGVLHLIGALVVSKILRDRDAAAQEFGCPATDLWDATEHVIASQVTPMDFDRVVPLATTQAIRFISNTGEVPPKFSSPGHLDQQTLRSVRPLTPQSASLLLQLLPPFRDLVNPSETGVSGAPPTPLPQPPPVPVAPPMAPAVAAAPTGPGTVWTAAEVAATVETYLAMLQEELNGKSYSKADYRRGLLRQLHGRTEAAVERKFGNVSAVMIGMHLPYIEGYKPWGNYQGLLEEAVEDTLDKDQTLRKALQAAAVAVPPVSPANLLKGITGTIKVQPPPPRPATISAPLPTGGTRPPVTPTKIDYQALEAANRKLGKMGEEFVVELERRILTDDGRPDLARQVEWVAETRGDGLGYDVESYLPTGQKVCIEVKTTNQGIAYPFLLTPNELAVSDALDATYQLYRLFRFSRQPQYFELIGSLSQRRVAGEIELLPRLYEVRF